MNAADELAPSVGIVAACHALGVSRASFYRRLRPAAAPTAPTPRSPSPSPRALTQAERQTVLELLHSPRFVDQAPAQVHATLLDEGIYHCSTRTMYRLLTDADEVRERRSQLQHPVYHKPELVATGPNQVWSWDITLLPGPGKGSRFHLYVILDIFSRYVVGWLLAHWECSHLAQRLIRETAAREGVQPEQLTLHSDRGPAMKSQTVAQLLAALGITKSQSRPHVSNDNPFSESQFKTTKYCSEFPDRFECYEEAHAFCVWFFPWYNHEHYHSGLGYLTPASVHHGQAGVIVAQRSQVLQVAYAAHPERFVHGPPKPQTVPTAVWINPPKEDENPAIALAETMR